MTFFDLDFLTQPFLSYYRGVDHMEAVIFGSHEESTLRQFTHCLQTGNVVGGVLCADGHYGYSQPVGGVVVYDGQISPSGVGYDIACGNKAVKTDLTYHDIKENLPLIMDQITAKIPFGIGKKNKRRVDHELFDDATWDLFREFGKHEHDQLKALASSQLGTVGSGNHYVDILIDQATNEVWIGNHFGSRGLGHRIATGFLNLANGRKFADKAPGESMEQPPTLLNMESELGQMYYKAMKLAGRYAYAGRDHVMDQVLQILDAKSEFEVHNHHNYAWKEIHHGKEVIVVRKGATPAAPGQLGFVGGSMGDISVILQGRDSEKSREAFYSTVHGSGRIMSRTQAAGKMNWRTRRRTGGAISTERMDQAVKDYGVVLRGGGTDESPFVYRKLQGVLDAHEGTIDIMNILKPVGVVMA